MLNLVPTQRSGSIAQDTALTDASGFCPIDPATMRSTRDPAISVLGDACIAGDMPKSAFAAHSQARVAVANLLGKLLDRPIPTARHGNICWNQVADGYAIKVGGGYASSSDRIATTDSFIGETSDDAATRRANVGNASTVRRPTCGIDDAFCPDDSRTTHRPPRTMTPPPTACRPPACRAIRR